MAYDFQALKEHLQDYAEEHLERSPRAGRDMYVCPLCGSGTGPSGTGAFSLHGNGWTCHACGEGGDIVDLDMALTGATRADSARALSQHYGVRVEEAYSFPASVLPTTPKTAPRADLTASPPQRAERVNATTKTAHRATSSADYSPWITACQKTPLEDSPAAVTYLKEHGLSLQEAQQAGLGLWDTAKTASAWNPAWGTPPESPALIFPNETRSYWHARTLSAHAAHRWDKPLTDKAGRDPLTGSSLLEDTGVVFLVEGAGDYVALQALGARALCLGGTGGYRRASELLQNFPGLIIVDALDNDKGGRETAARLREALAPRPVLSLWDTAGTLEGAKDPAEWLAQDRAGLSQALQAVPRNTAEQRELDSVGAQLDGFLQRVKDQDPSEITPTGFSSIDSELDGGIYPGLYILGALSSLGKTTLALQIADNIAGAQTRDVIVISLEQGRDELIAKSLSRLTRAQTGAQSPALTSRSISTYSRWESFTQTQKDALASAIKTYREEAKHLWIYEGVGNIGVSAIRAIVESHVQDTERRPLIVVDYLQILAPVDPRLTDKANTDKAVTELKRLSRDFNLPVLAISSLNRASYSGPVSMESFKESGAIEYGSDVLLGLQPAGIQADEKAASKNKTLTDVLRSKDTREMELKILKNRNGKTGGVVALDFEAMFSYFRQPAYGGVTRSRKTY